MTAMNNQNKSLKSQRSHDKRLRPESKRVGNIFENSLEVSDFAPNFSHRTELSRVRQNQKKLFDGPIFTMEIGCVYGTIALLGKQPHWGFKDRNLLSGADLGLFSREWCGFLNF